MPTIWVIQLWRTAALKTDRRDHPGDASAAYLTPDVVALWPPPLIWSRLMRASEGSDPRQLATYNAAEPWVRTLSSPLAAMKLHSRMATLFPVAGIAFGV
jgi:hypothetical protein